MNGGLPYMVVLKCCYLLLSISIKGHNNNPSDPLVEVKPNSGAFTKTNLGSADFIQYDTQHKIVYEFG